MCGQPETFPVQTIDGEIMSRGIERDLFASLMRLSARERTEILEFLGQSAVAPDTVLREAGARRSCMPRRQRLRCGDLVAQVTDVRHAT